MPYLIISRDNPQKRHIREEFMDEHIAYLNSNLDKILAAGAIQTDDGANIVGGMIVLETESKADAEAFYVRDPFTREGLRGEISIQRWRKGFFNHKCLR